MIFPLKSNLCTIPTPSTLTTQVNTKLEIKIENNIYWIATERMDELNNYAVEVIENCSGSELIGATYVPAYSEYEYLFNDGAF